MKKLFKTPLMTIILAATTLFGGALRAQAQQKPAQKQQKQTVVQVQPGQGVIQVPNTNTIVQLPNVWWPQQNVTVIVNGCPCETSAETKKAITKAHTTTKKVTTHKTTAKKTVKKTVTPAKKTTTPVVTKAATPVVTAQTPVDTTKKPVDSVKTAIPTDTLKTAVTTPAADSTGRDTLKTVAATPVITTATDTATVKKSPLDKIKQKISTVVDTLKGKTSAIPSITNVITNTNINKNEVKVDLGLPKTQEVTKKGRFALVASTGFYTGNKNYTVTETHQELFPIQKPEGYTGGWSFPKYQDVTTQKTKQLSSFSYGLGMEYGLSKTFYAAAGARINGLGKLSGYAGLGAETSGQKTLGLGNEIGANVGGGKIALYNYTYARIGKDSNLLNGKIGYTTGQQFSGISLPGQIQAQLRINLGNIKKTQHRR